MTAMLQLETSFLSTAIRRNLAVAASGVVAAVGLAQATR